MPVLKDQIVIVDIEATCWETDPPPGERNEIIEVGICLLDAATFTPSDKLSLMVKPTMSKISPFCTRLTSITPQMVENGMRFDEACAIIAERYDAPHRLWASWGNYDKRMFKEQCALMKVDYPFSALHLNIKSLFAIVENHRTRMGMANALEKLGLPMVGTHHRGDDDAWNIARILGQMLHVHTTDILKKYW